MDIKLQAVTGVIPPGTAEAQIREVYPSVASMPVVATLGKALMFTYIFAPVSWVVMAGAYFGKLAPFMMRRYCLTNRRVMIRAGWAGKPIKEVLLADVDDVRLVRDGNTDFFRAANIEIIGKGQTLLTLPGVPDPESFRHAILDARNAWVPGKAKMSMHFMAASAAK
jgi:hypothetical protein